jgi:hypothetical protein
MAADTRLRTLDLAKNGNVEVMVHTPQFTDERLSISLSVRDDSEHASQRMTPAQARALAALLVVAAEDAERRNAMKAVA